MEKKAAAYGLRRYYFLFRVSTRGSIARQEYAILQYEEVTRPIRSTVQEILACVHLGCSTHDEVDRCLRQDTGILEH